MYPSDLIPVFRHLREVTKEQPIVRLTTTVVFGIRIACTIEVMYGIVAITCVGLHISDPKYWRPCFGSLSDAYTLRRFWR